MISRTKAAHQTDQAEQRKRLIDEYGQLDAELAPHKSKQRRLEELARVIRSWHADADPEASVSSAGDRFEVVLSPCGMQTRADIPGVYRMLGKAEFLKLANVTLKSLEQALDASAVAALTVKERTGYRAMVVKAITP